MGRGDALHAAQLRLVLDRGDPRAAGQHLPHLGGGSVHAEHEPARSGGRAEEHDGDELACQRHGRHAAHADARLRLRLRRRDRQPGLHLGLRRRRRRDARLRHRPDGAGGRALERAAAPAPGPVQPRHQPRRARRLGAALLGGRPASRPRRRRRRQRERALPRPSDRPAPHRRHFRRAGARAAALARARPLPRLERARRRRRLARGACALRRERARRAPGHRFHGHGAGVRAGQPQARRVRLAFVTGSLVHGGAERQAITLANRLAERGHDCHLIYVKNDPSQLGRVHLPAPSTVRCLHAKRYFDLGALSHLHALLERLDPQVLLASNAYALMYASLANAGAPLMVTLHSTYLRTLKEQLQMAAYRPLFWRSACTVFVCERQKRHWLARGVFGRRNEVIYNGVDLEHWQPVDATALRRALGFAPSDYVIGLSAVLRPEKNPAQLIDAVARLRAIGLPARALYIGDGPERARVEARARALGVADRFVISGFQEDVRPFLSACDVVTLTSFTEAFSLAAVEAMALGRPVVHPEVGGAAEMPVARTRIGENARATVAARFSERSMVARYEQVLAELATSRSKRAQLRNRATAH
ncbi:MAG: glycosyltransferase [Betaproteobacteria bacterium]|nr:MAG: glycosyltransferase [Betaproteobacteria bacterium]